MSLINRIIDALVAIFSRKGPTAAPVRVGTSSPAQRRAMAAAIINFEARRDSKGRLAVYGLPSWDGGGTFEVAGINDRYHPKMAHRLAALIKDGKHAEAEREVEDYLLTYTDAVKDWSTLPAIEFVLRDCAFNRGPTGAARILQYSLRTEVDGIVGPETTALLEKAEQHPEALLQALRRGREAYERSPYVGRDESSTPWRGLVNRWNKVTETAKKFLSGGEHAQPASAKHSAFQMWP